MANDKERSLSELIADTDLMTAAIRQGVREELLSHARAGNPVPESRDGQVVWITPEEIFKRLGSVPPSETEAS